MPADATERLAAAARRRHQHALARCKETLTRLETNGAAVTFTSVAAEAGVSRAWLYTQPDIRDTIDRLRERNNRSAGAAVPTRQRTSEPSLLRRLEAAHLRNQDLTRENTLLREQLAAAHRALRDAGYTEGVAAGHTPL